MRDNVVYLTQYAFIPFPLGVCAAQIRDVPYHIG